MFEQPIAIGALVLLATSAARGDATVPQPAGNVVAATRASYSHGYGADTLHCATPRLESWQLVRMLRVPSTALQAAAHAASSSPPSSPPSSGIEIVRGGPYEVLQSPPKHATSVFAASPATATMTARHNTPRL